MKNRLPIAFTISMLIAFGMIPPNLSAKKRASAAQSSAPDQTPLTPDQIHELISRTIENQHRDDAALDSFERIECHITHPDGPQQAATSKKTYRVVPTGSGTLRLLIRQNGAPISPVLYHRELRDWESILAVAVHADDPREIAVIAKQEKRRKERARFVGAVPSAFRITWLGREIRDGRTLEKLQFEPNPNYPPHGDTTDWLSHARAIAWIDPQAAQVVSVDASILRDINFGGGVLGKIYHGGRFHMEQAPVAPGIWEPSLYQYDISGRKFLFSFVMHEVTSSTHYTFLDGPQKALEEAQNDLAHCCTISADP